LKPIFIDQKLKIILKYKIKNIQFLEFWSEILLIHS
jgi:hypothetical protein